MEFSIDQAPTMELRERDSGIYICIFVSLWSPFIYLLLEPVCQ